MSVPLSWGRRIEIKITMEHIRELPTVGTHVHTKSFRVFGGKIVQYTRYFFAMTICQVMIRQELWYRLVTMLSVARYKTNISLAGKNR